MQAGAAVPGSEDLAAPDRAVGAVAGAVEDQAEGRFGRGWGRVRPGRRPGGRGGAGRGTSALARVAGLFPRPPRAGEVAGMQVADDPLWRGRERWTLKWSTACSNASSVSRFSISPMCWLMKA